MFFKKEEMFYLEVHEFFHIIRLCILKNYYSVNHLPSAVCIQNGRGRTVTFSLKKKKKKKRGS